MKKAINMSAIALLLMISLAAPAGRVMNTPQAAAESYKPFEQTYSQLRKQGYTMISVEENPVMYIMAPEGDYLWGNVTYTLINKPFENSLETSYVTITVDVTWKDRKGGYVGTGMNQTELTVY